MEPINVIKTLIYVNSKNPINLWVQQSELKVAQYIGPKKILDSSTKIFIMNLCWFID
jgi:hypothetical protein